MNIKEITTADLYEILDEDFPGWEDTFGVMAELAPEMVLEALGVEA